MTKSSSIIALAIVVLGLCSFTASAGSLRQQLDVGLHYNIFKDWMTLTSKQYGVEEMAVRFYNWKANYDLVQEHNGKDLSYQLEMNNFADMTPEEFSSLHLGFNPELAKKKEHKKENHHTNHTNHSNHSNHSHPEPHHNNHTLPKSVDWRKEKAVTEVKNQGQCGGCWSFAASGALEGLHAIKEKKLTSFSEQQMLDCSSDYGNQGCDGGLMTNAYHYTEKHGIEPEKGYEYTASVGTCKQNPKRVAFRNSGYKEVIANNHTDLKHAVARQPVSVGIEASGTAVQLFKSGVINHNCGTQLDHGVLVVGYDVTKKGEGYWIVKNSWGPTWGLKGYFHIAAGSQNDGAGVCGINMMASYPTKH